MKTIRIFIAAALMLGFTPGALALIAVDAAVGTRSLKVDPDGGDSKTFSGTPMRVAVHLDPIPLVPVSFGLGVGIWTVDGESGSAFTKGGGGNEISLEVKGWIPFVPIVTPYGRLGYVISSASNAVLEGDNSLKAKYLVGGTQLALGAEWSPLPLIGVIFEVVTSNLTFALDNYEIGGQQVSSDADAKVTGTDILVGVSVGI